MGEFKNNMKGMDELKINLRHGILGKCLTMVIKSAIYKKFGIDVNVELNELNVFNCGERVHIHIDMDAETNMDEFNTIVKNLL